MNRVSDFQCVSAGWRAPMETGRREKAQCQSGQLDGNKAAVDGDAVDLHGEKHSLLSLLIHTHTRCLQMKYTHPHTQSNQLGHR